MATDKKISELGLATGIVSSDVSVLVKDGVNYQFSFTQLIEYLSSNLVVGSKMTFGTVLPQNTAGKNGDVFLKTDTGRIYQKLNGSWSSSYLPIINSTPDSTVLYDVGEPADDIGANNDSYIDVSTGIFYKKSSNEWSQVFSMANGPQGPRGNSILNGTTDPNNSLGVNGDFYLNKTTLNISGPKASGVWPVSTNLKGTDGNTLHHGSGNPSNSLGIIGDFYLNVDSYTIFGPKSNNYWSGGTSLLYFPQAPAVIQIPEGSPIPFVINYAINYNDYGNNPIIIVEDKINDSKRRIVWDVGIDKKYLFDELDTIDIYGHDSGDGLTTVGDIIVTLKP